MKTAVMTDTNSGITLEEGNRYGIYVLPMPVIIDGKDYLEELTLTHDILYKALNENRDIVSSQPSPGSLTEMWDKILSDGYDELVYIPMSSGLSGSCSTAKALAADYDGKVVVIDNHRISITLLDSVYDAKYLSNTGKNASEIKAVLEENAYQNDIYITLHSLKRITKTGRITAAGAAIATVLNLKPILKIQGGKLDAYARVRGMASAEEKMFEAVHKDLEGKYAGVPKDKLSIGAAGTLEDKRAAKQWVDKVKAEFPGYKVTYRPLACSIACHIGTNTQGVAVGLTTRTLKID
ncbi:DegV family protein [Ruminococcus flavefaciens]|uniref:DegV family protein n=1 Tax=Ruminococcus flavefaciens TaxID=1265 RepID=UPI0026EFCA30|nr:DegV family protein [Ruminococcus flavefaciens]MDD7518202.1 DegV family protein [Ruminococcus flavefaciens]MDY5690611.1 DegV family protein [Ruminococcus flavefaciens]